MEHSFEQGHRQRYEIVTCFSLFCESLTTNYMKYYDGRHCWSSSLSLVMQLDVLMHRHKVQIYACDP